MNTRVAHMRDKNKAAGQAVYIGRPSKWGNPFVIGKDGTRDDVIRKFENWILKQPELMAALHELRGKTLLCFCAPNACHGDVLACLADLQKKVSFPERCI